MRALVAADVVLDRVLALQEVVLGKLDSLFGFLWEVVTLALESGHWNAHFVFVSIVFD